MPIKDPKIYPPYWKQFSEYIRFERAGNCCEECGVRNGYLKFTALEKYWSPEPIMIIDPNDDDALEEANHRYAGVKHRETVIVLTVAHLDNTGGVCDCKARTGLKCANPSHVKALCQACHLWLDLPKHMANRRATIAEAKDATRGLFANV